jgi:hypothetical protein
MRIRKTYRDRETSSATTSGSSSRIYEAELRYENPDSRFEFGVGRLLARELRGVGYLDGTFLRYKLNSKLSAGIFGGTEPDLENTDFQTDIVKGGIYTAYENRMKDGGRVTATLSFASAYQDGEIDREFIYQQIGYNFGSQFRIYESAELNLYRGWLKDAQGSSLELSSLQLNSSYAISRALAFTLGYDNRTNYYTYESRSVPDSLFDNAMRQGWRGSVNVRISSKASAEAGAGLRTTEGDMKDTRSGWLRLGVVDLFSSSIGITALVRTFNSPYSDGYQPSLQVSRSLIWNVRGAVEAGSNNYKLKQSDEKIEQQWLRLMLEAALGSSLYVTVDAEAARGSNRDANIATLGLGYRF